MERFTNSDIKCLEEAYSDVQMYNEGVWDRMKAEAAGLKQSVKNLGSNTAAYAKNVASNLKAKGTVYAKGIAAKAGNKIYGDGTTDNYKNNALEDYRNSLKSNNQTFTDIKNANAKKANNAKAQSILLSYEKKINKLHDELKNDINKLKLTDNQKKLNAVLGQLTGTMTQLRTLLGFKK